MIREIVTIDETRCDGCGLCVPACQEGAIRIINGKAKLVAEQLCDGLGACLGHCPRGAIRIERRESEAFSEDAVRKHLAALRAAAPAATPPTAPAAGAEGPARAHGRAGGGCPGSRMRTFDRPVSAPAASSHPGAASAASRSELRHWPVQLRLLPATAPVLAGARLLVAADCVPVAYAGFHPDLLRGRAVVIACPKLDDTRGYVEKLARMIAGRGPTDITVAHMEVPCCTGILYAVLEARQLAGTAVPVHDVVISTDGEVLSRRTL